MLSGLTQYVPEATLTVYDNLEFLIRLLLSAALGALVGLERSKRRKEADSSRRMRNSRLS